jgi:hypothetical protein
MERADGCDVPSEKSLLNLTPTLQIVGPPITRKSSSIEAVRAGARVTEWVQAAERLHAMLASMDYLVQPYLANRDLVVERGNERVAYSLWKPACVCSSPATWARSVIRAQPRIASILIYISIDIACSLSLTVMPHLLLHLYLTHSPSIP